MDVVQEGSTTLDLSRVPGIDTQGSCDFDFIAICLAMRYNIYFTYDDDK
jgi:hypothetical protein